jgi:phage tail-like protein
MATLQDPYKGFRFLVQIDQINQAGFMECSALGSHLEVIEYREGGDPKRVRKFAGKASSPDVTLKLGMTDNMELYTWHINNVNGVMDRRHGSIVQLDDTGSEKLRWNLYNMWPSKWDGAAYNAKGNELSIISVTLSYEYSEMA